MSELDGFLEDDSQVCYLPTPEEIEAQCKILKETKYNRIGSGSRIRKTSGLRVISLGGTHPSWEMSPGVPREKLHGEGNKNRLGKKNKRKKKR